MRKVLFFILSFIVMSSALPAQSSANDYVVLEVVRAGAIGRAYTYENLKQTAYSYWERGQQNTVAMATLLTGRSQVITSIGWRTLPFTAVEEDLASRAYRAIHGTKYIDDVWAVTFSVADTNNFRTICYLVTILLQSNGRYTYSLARSIAAPQ